MTTPALEACRLLLESYNVQGGHRITKRIQAAQKAKEALEAATQQDDTRTLNIGSGR